MRGRGLQAAASAACQSKRHPSGDLCQSTVLLQTDGVNILTDPICSERAGPFSWTGAKRIREPGIRFDELPEIDVILISHDHYDHLDIPTLKKIIESSHPVIVGGLGLAKRLAPLNHDNIKQLDWWQEYSYSPTGKITFVPSRHGSGRGLFDKNKTLWGGFVIEAPAGNILFMGDTAFGMFFEDIRRSCPIWKQGTKRFSTVCARKKEWLSKTC